MSGDVEENVSIFLSFSNLGVKIDDRQILQNVSGKVHPGEMLAVMGPSGKCIVLYSVPSSHLPKNLIIKSENVRVIKLVLPMRFWFLLRHNNCKGYNLHLINGHEGNS